MNIPAKEILPLWQDRIGAAITGEHWLDFTAAGKDKGLHLLCAHFGIPQENTYASVTATTMPHAPCRGAPLSDAHCACRFKGRVCHADR